MSRRAAKPHERTTEPCVICGRPSKWNHHVAGHANAPEVTIRVCRRCADLLDAFLSLAGVKLKHGEPRTDAELAWAAISGLDGLGAARDGKPQLSPVALAAVRLLAAHSAEVRGPRPAAADARHRKHRRPVAATASFEAARARATHDQFAPFPGVTERLPHLLALLAYLAAKPETFEVFERLDPEAVQPLYANFGHVAVELLDAWRADEAGEADAGATLQLVERRFEQAARSLAEAIVCAINDAAVPRDASA